MATRRQVMEALVKEEAKKLRKIASPKEISRLHFGTLDPNSYKKCIYGQMTGDCFSERAIELIGSCCRRVYRGYEDLEDARVNGSPKGKYRSEVWSPIEVFIIQERNRQNGNNEKLVKYLKGEINRLNFAK